MIILVYPIYKRTLLPLIRLFVREVKGIKNIPSKGPFILISNHQCYLDPFLISSVMMPIQNKKIHFLAEKGRFWDFFGDTISRKWAGCVCADDGREKVLQELSSLLKKGKNVAIFIEGRRSDDGKLKRGKVGAASLALEAQVPILPVGLVGSFDIAPGTQLIPNLKRSEIRIGKLIYLDKYYKKKVTVSRDKQVFSLGK